MRVLVLGVNGFIGHSLAGRILADTDWRLAGIDLESDRVAAHLDHPRFEFTAGDLAVEQRWVDEQVRAADVVLPLAATARPADYVRDPLSVFELDFEENLRVVRLCTEHATRVVFPSTSEVYGRCPEELMNEETSPLVLGPIHRQRWIYSCSKQLLDRLIWAYGDRGLPFTLFRPFNWFGPGLDRLDQAQAGSSRVITQFLGHLLRGEPVSLVDGGRQRRCFTYVDDGIDGLMRILENRGGCADRRIFNLGNPANDCSVRQLAYLLADVLAGFPGYERVRETASFEEVEATSYYGAAYEDVDRRVPDVAAARDLLGWEPKVPLREALGRTVAHYLEAAAPAVGALASGAG